jgi:hypothetical protein
VAARAALTLSWRRTGMTTLYAWATPAFYSEAPVDHTWVTDYDNQVDDY